MKYRNKSDFILVILAFLIFLFFVKSSISQTIFIRSFALVSIIGALILTFLNKKTSKFSNVVILSTSVYVVWFGISTLYANAGKFAINEYIKLLVGFAVFLAILYSNRQKFTLNKIMWCITSLSAVIAFLSIEGASFGLIEPIFEMKFYGTLIQEYAVFGSNRVSSIFGITNAYVTLLGTTLFLSLYLYLNSKNKVCRYIQGFYIVLFANAVLLAFSLGGTFSLAVASLAFVIFAQKETKTRGIIIIIEALIISLISVLFTIDTYINNEISGSILPLVAVALGGIFFIIFDNIIGEKISQVLLKYLKTATISVVVLIAVSIFGAIFVFNQLEPAEIAGHTVFSRVVYLEEGQYEIEVSADNYENVGVRIVASDLEEVLLNTRSTLIYVQDISEENSIISFEVPKGTEEVGVWILNSNDESIVVDGITIDGVERVEVPLQYKYIPENMVSRLQGLRTNNSLMTRIQYVKDGWELFLQSPILGHGLGGFENAVQSVQKYQYETKYAHNHFIQTLVDGGIIGFISYVALIGSCVFALIKSRKTNDVAPMLFGALTMIIVHSTFEFSMSIEQFIPFAFAVFGVIAVTCDMEIERLEKYNNKIFTGVVCAISLFATFLAGNIIANININGNQVTLNTLTTNASIDIYEKNDYKLSYVLATSTSTDVNIRATSANYLKSLEKAKSNTISLYLADYYIDNANPEKSYEQIVNYIEYSLYDPDTWNLAISQYITTLFSDENIEHFFTNKETYIEIIEDLIDKLEVTNQSSISTITIDDYVLMNIRNVMASRDIETLEEFSTYISTVIYDSKYDTTINNKGVYDALSLNYTSMDIQGDTTNSGERARIRVPYTYYAMYKIEIDSANVSRITAPTDELNFTVTDEGKTIALIDTNTISSLVNATEGYVDIIINFSGNDAYFGGVKISR